MTTITPRLLLLAEEGWTWRDLNADNWIAIGSAAFALAGVIAAVFAVVYSRSSAKSSKASADAAQKSADEAARLSQIEIDREHNRYAPDHPGILHAEEEVDHRSPAGHYVAFASITLPRTYRARAETWNGTSFTPIAIPLLLDGGKPHRFFIDQVVPGVTPPGEVRFHLWPPLAGVDDTIPWSCPCGGPTGEDIAGRAHWELRIPIEYMPEVEEF
ncbi:hypothetical protein [Microbispora bryophytorum]|uniref:hypothetical protein n=1 Tax=Microbispora bryophytorum TaxID=1460882 RepID=UPI0034102474